MSGATEHRQSLHCGAASPELTAPEWQAHAQLSRGLAERAERDGDGALAAYLRRAASRLAWRAAETEAAALWARQRRRSIS
jgi:hypothetical protein